jgi:hypothetical protein
MYSEEVAAKLKRAAGAKKVYQTFTFRIVDLTPV